MDINLLVSLLGGIIGCLIIVYLVLFYDKHQWEEFVKTNNIRYSTEYLNSPLANKESFVKNAIEAIKSRDLDRSSFRLTSHGFAFISDNLSFGIFKMQVGFIRKDHVYSVCVSTTGAKIVKYDEYGSNGVLCSFYQSLEKIYEEVI